ncbi:MAG TPA: o-succinylbenzoate synthase [Opitutaceae bacterium]|nr:o-succinylbenzoate synthase [Opitutaceae bacterium]
MDFRFEFRRYSLAFRHPVRTSLGAWGTREGIYVRIERPDGTIGMGEAAPVPFFGPDSVELSEVTCISLGSKVDENVLSRVPRKQASLRNAIATALGGPADEPVHASLAVAALLPAGRAAFDIAPLKADTGFRTFKWKVGVGAADDERAMLDDLIGALPGGSKLRLDANGAWDRKTAAQWLAHAADRPIEFVEQPVAADTRGARDTLLGLAGDFPVPIALDESIVEEGDVTEWLDSGWPGYFVIKPSLLGDARSTLAQLAVAGARVVFSSSLETAMGSQAALRLAFSWPGKPSALGFGVWPLFSDARFDGPFATPFFRSQDINATDMEALWNAVT